MCHGHTEKLSAQIPFVGRSTLNSLGESGRWKMGKICLVSKHLRVSFGFWFRLQFHYFNVPDGTEGTGKLFKSLFIKASAEAATFVCVLREGVSANEIILTAAALRLAMACGPAGQNYASQTC